MSVRAQLVEDRKRRIEAIANERRAYPSIIVRDPNGIVRKIRKAAGSI